MDELKLDSCALCGKKGSLECSHIIPKFVFRYFKDTSTGRMRRVDNVNILHQDGQKLDLLCSSCEDMFNIAETKFANTIFYPYMSDNVKGFQYEKWLYYFMISVSWRCLYLDLLGFVKEGKIGLEAINNLANSERIMREYLLGNTENAGTIENHIFFFEDLEKAPDKIKGLQPHVSIHRSIGGYTVVNNKYKTYMTLTNLMGIFLITIYNKGNNENWKNTQIYDTGIIKSKNQEIKSIFALELEAIMHKINTSKKELSDKQYNVTKKRLEGLGEKIMNHKIIEDFLKDMELEGRE